MSTGFGGAATHDLTRVGLTLAPQPRRARAVLFVVALVAAAFATGAAVVLVQERAQPVVVRAPIVAPAPAPELPQLRQQLEQAKMSLRLAEARGQELERQVDALNQQLTESQDELTFFRKAREGRKR
jgi:septal ring factor EnvC (AmiA/AmiB activator)